MTSRKEEYSVVDAAEEPVLVLPALVDVQDISDHNLTNSLGSVWNAIPNLEKKLEQARRIDANASRMGLTDDEAAAIRLYVLDNDDPNCSISCQLNRWLRSVDRKSNGLWSKYLKLLLQALNKLPSVKTIVYRFAHIDVVGRYHEQQQLTWFGFNSCSTKIEQIYTTQMVNESQVLFIIECIHGKSISSFGDFPIHEILLMPETHFRVKKLALGSTRCAVIFLEELPRTDLRSNRSLKQPISMIHPETNVPNQYAHEKEKTYVPDLPISHRQVEKIWFDRQFHSDPPSTILRPHELEKQMSYPNMSTSNSNILNRIRGSMIGLALGDSLGAHVEFRPRQILLEHPVIDLEGGGTWGLNKGQFTDDTSMALCLGISLVCRAGFHPYDQLVRYKWWYRDGYMSSTGKCFDIGTATSEALDEFEHRQELFAYQHRISQHELDYISDSNLLKSFHVQCSGSDVAGNGALMRLAPVPLFFYRFPTHAVNYSGRSAELTHGDPKARDACRYYAALIVAVLHNEDKEQLLSKEFYENHRLWFGSIDLVPEVKKIAKGSYKKQRGYDDGIRGKGYIIDALEAALWAFWSTENFRDGALAAVNLGDDTDTTAAIYGQLAGAFYGYDVLPRQWIQDLYAREFLLCLSSWIEYQGGLWFPE